MPSVLPFRKKAVFWIPLIIVGLRAIERTESNQAIIVFGLCHPPVKTNQRQPVKYHRLNANLLCLDNQQGKQWTIKNEISDMAFCVTVTHTKNWMMSIEFTVRWGKRNVIGFEVVDIC